MRRQAGCPETAGNTESREGAEKPTGAGQRETETREGDIRGTERQGKR